MFTCMYVILLSEIIRFSVTLFVDAFPVEFGMARRYNWSRATETRVFKKWDTGPTFLKVRKARYK